RPPERALGVAVDVAVNGRRRGRNRIAVRGGALEHLAPHHGEFRVHRHLRDDRRLHRLIHGERGRINRRVAGDGAERDHQKVLFRTLWRPSPWSPWSPSPPGPTLPTPEPPVTIPPPPPAAPPPVPRATAVRLPAPRRHI